jgi:hypothetical protein
MRQLWRSGDEARFFEALVHDNPRQDGEGAIAYTERIALLAGALKRRLMLAPDVNLHRGEQLRVDDTPYSNAREPGEEG